MSSKNKPAIGAAFSATQFLNRLLPTASALTGLVITRLINCEQRRRQLLGSRSRRRAARSRRGPQDRHTTRSDHFMEGLESRVHLSSVTATQANLTAATAVVTPTFQLYRPDGVTPAASGSAPAGITPAQMQTAYGVNLISFGGITGNGSGETIALIDAYNQPDIASDLEAFDQNFGLQQMNVAGGPAFTEINENGGSTLPSDAATGGWGVEISLDVEWAHVIAPEANILLVEANSNSASDLYQAVSTAADKPGVVAVSMSWSSPEESSDLSDNSIFTTPAGHTGVTFLAATGDDGVPSGYPAYSPNVVAVGGTTLNISSSGAYISETGWSDSGGGISTVEAQPAYQNGVVTQSTTMRTNPDVAMDANPDTGVSVYDTYDFGSTDPWEQVGGTSLATPMFAGLIAIADQGRSLQGLSSLDGPSSTLPLLYSMSSSNFHDITSGNNGYPAQAGYDLVTGLGSPVANLLVESLAGANLAQLAFIQQPANAAAAAAISPTITVDVENAAGVLETINDSSVTLSIYSGPTDATLDGTLTVTAADGVATFSDVSLPTAGTYTLRASDSASLVLAAISQSFTISPDSGTHLGFGVQPGDTGVGEDIDSPGGVMVDVLDAYDNIATSDDSGSVTIALASSPSDATLGGTLTEPVVNGVATFSNLMLTVQGAYTLQATDGALGSVTSNSFTIGPASAAQLAFVQQPTNAQAGATITPAITVDVEDQAGDLVTNNDSYVSLYIETGPGSDDSRPVTVAAVNGVATFEVYLVDAGTYTLEAVDSSDSQLTPATSDSFTISAGAAAQLAFTQKPVGGSAGVVITPAVTIAVEDQYGNVVTTDSSSVTLAIASGPSGATLDGTLTVAAVDGVATFSNLSLPQSGNYTLSATDGSLTSVTSTSFTITPDSFQTLSTFDGSNGSEPEAGLIMDAEGNLYGTTSGIVGSSYTGDGTIFEIAKGSDTVTTLASFNGDNGSVPEAGLIMDAEGNLYGTTTGLNDLNDDGTVFELPKGSSTITTLATFNGNNGSVPVAGLIMDASGNLYGTTTGIDDSGDDGTVFELAKGSNTITTLATFNGTNGSVPEAGLIMDANGNLYGTTAGLEDPRDDGTVFELPKGSGTITTLATFNGANGSEPLAGVIMDAEGNLYGTTSGIHGFRGGDGTVFELPKGSSTITTLVTFNGNNGSEPLAGLIMDADGNLYGTTTGAHDPDDDGTIFELPQGGTSVIILATFDGSNGSVPEAGLIMDASGNLYGTTTGLDDTSDDGTVFELSPLAAQVLPTQLAFVQQPTNTTAGATMTPSVTVDVEDASGNLLTAANSDVTLTIATGPTDATLGGTVTVAAVDGLATFSDLDLTTAGAYTLTANDGSLTAATSSSFTIAPAAATQLAMVQQPSTTTAGVAISPAVTIDVLDAYGNLVTSDSSNVTMALAITPEVTPAVSILSGTLTVTASDGVATFSNLILTTTGDYSLIATDGALASVTSNSFTVTPSTATHLAIVQEPVNTETGITMSPAVTVDVLDAYGNLVAGDSSTVTLAIVTGPTGAGISGQTTETASGGVATFSDIALTDVGTYTLQVSDGALTSATSTSFEVYAAQATQLAFVQQPTNTAVAQTIAPPLKVDVEDSNGNLIVTDDSSVTIAITSGSGPSGSVLDGTLTVDAINGVATFSDLSLSMSGTYTLTATDGMLQAATSNSFSITATPSITWPTPASITYGTPLSATQLDATASYDGTPVAGTFVYTPAAGTVLHAGADQTLSVVFTPADTDEYAAVDDSTLITVNKATPVVTWASPTDITYGTALSSTQLDATANIPGSFDYTPAAGTVLQAGTNQTLSVVFTPTDTTDYATAEGSTPITVNKATPTVTWADPSAITYGAALSGTQLDATANVMGTFVYTPANGTVLHAGADQTLSVVFTPTDAADYTTAGGSTQITVNRATPVVTWANPANIIHGVALSAAQFDATANVPGTFVYTPAAGKVLPVGADQTLSVVFTPTDTTDYTTATASARISVLPVTATELVFTSLPADATAGATMAKVVVKIEGADDKVETTDDSAVSLTIASGPSATGSFAGTSTVTVNAVDGVATFDNLVLDTAGTYKLAAADVVDAISGFTSGSFKINPGAVSGVTFVQQPTDVVAGKDISPGITVVVKDAEGNLVSGSKVTLAIDTKPAGGELLGALSATTSTAGIATFSDISVHVAGQYALIAMDGAVRSAASNDFVVAPAAPAKLVYTAQPANAVAGSTLPAVVVQVRDAYGNLETNTSAVSLTIASGPPETPGTNSFTGSSTTTVNTLDGVATFSNLILDAAGTYKLEATDAADALGGIKSDSFKIDPGAVANLTFIKQPPASVVAGKNVNPAITVVTKDAYGNVISGAKVTLAISTGPAGGTLLGVLSATTSTAGLATFHGISAHVAGQYSLVAAVGVVSSPASDNFIVTPASPAKLDYATPPANSTAGSPLAAVVVEILDTYGNLATDNNSAVSLTIDSGPGSFTGSSTTTVNAVDGVATFTNLVLDTAGTYTIKAADSKYGLSVTSATFMVI